MPAKVYRSSEAPEADGLAHYASFTLEERIQIMF